MVIEFPFRAVAVGGTLLLTPTPPPSPPPPFIPLAMPFALSVLSPPPLPSFLKLFIVRCYQGVGNPVVQIVFQSDPLLHASHRHPQAAPHPCPLPLQPSSHWREDGQ